MTNPVVVSSKLYVTSSDAGVANVPLPAYGVDDIILVYSFGGHDIVGDPVSVSADGYDAVWGFSDADYFGALLARRAIDIEETVVPLLLNAIIATPGLPWVTSVVVVRDAIAEGTWLDFLVGDIPYNTDETGALPAVSVDGSDRLVLQIATSVGTVAQAGVTGYTTYTGGIDHVGAIGGFWVTNNVLRATTDASIDEVTYTRDGELTGSSVVVELALAISGAATAPTVPFTPPNFQLRCATDYAAYITQMDYETRIDAVGWSSIRWGRILDEASDASVVIPDRYGGVRCCIPYGQIRPWRFGLTIERNDVEVWKGPITQVQRDTNKGTTTVSANDILARFVKRFATREIVDWLDTDAGTAYADLLNVHAYSTADVWAKTVPLVFTGAPVTRRLLPRRYEMAADILSELAESAIDGFILNGIPYVWDPRFGWRYVDPADEVTKTLEGPYNSNFDMVYGTFTAESFSELPNWAMNGMNQANFVVVPGADSGEFGFRDVFTAESTESQIDVGVLDYADPNTLQLPSDVTPSEAATALQGRANTYVDLHAFSAAVIQGGVLAEGAPIEVSDLIPGSLWVLDIWDHCYGQLLTMQRLKSVGVDVSFSDGQLVERISPTLYPVGFEGRRGVVPHELGAG